MKHVYALPLVALLLAGAAGLASASEPCPVTLRSVQITPTNTFQYQPDIGFVNVAYTNDRDVTATDVVFTLYADGLTVSSFEDKGTFATGAVIKRRFIDHSDALDQQISVAEVKYADGTVWTNAVPFEARRQAAFLSEIPPPAQ